MSIRAYRITKIENVASPSWNISHNENILDFLSNDLWDGRNYDGAGIIEVRVECLEQLLEEDSGVKLDEYEREAIAKDIAWANKRGNDYIQYYCY